jgi:hypothetical protein
MRTWKFCISAPLQASVQARRLRHTVIGVLRLLIELDPAKQRIAAMPTAVGVTLISLRQVGQGQHEDLAIVAERCKMIFGTKARQLRRAGLRLANRGEWPEACESSRGWAEIPPSTLSRRARFAWIAVGGRAWLFGGADRGGRCRCDLHVDRDRQAEHLQNGQGRCAILKTAAEPKIKSKGSNGSR